MKKIVIFFIFLFVNHSMIANPFNFSPAHMGYLVNDRYPETIKGSFCYSNTSGQKDSDGRYHKPCAYFKSVNDKTFGLQHCVEYDEWSEEQEKKIDAMIDPSITIKKPIYAILGFGRNWHRNLILFNDSDERNELGSWGYSGPIDIKNSKNHPEYRYLPKPHSLVSDIRKVTQYDCFISPMISSYPKKELLYHEGSSQIKKITEFDFFIWPDLFLYPKKELIYHDNGNIEEKITKQHLLIQGVRVFSWTALLCGILLVALG